MSTTQDLVLAEIAKIAKKHKLTAQVDRSYSNLGTVRIRRGLDTILSIAFDFQSNQATFALGSGYQPSYFGKHDAIFYIEYAAPKAFAPLLGKIMASLKGRAI